MTEFRKAVEYELELEQLAEEVEGLKVSGPYGTYTKGIIIAIDSSLPEMGN